MEKLESSHFKKWLSQLKDEKAKARIVARINRLLEGLPGDVSPVGQGVSELRIHVGPGYRVYYYQQGERLVLLLVGGDKSSQRRDINKAHKLLAAWRNQND